MAVIRLLLVTLVTTALIAAALPAIDHARTNVAAQTGRSELTDLTAAIHATAANDPVPPDTPGAHRLHHLQVPDPGPGTTGLAWIAIGATPDTDTPDSATTDVLAYRLPGGATKTIVVDVDIRVVFDGDVQPDDTPLLLRSNTRLRLTYIHADGRSVVRITRVRL